MANLQRFPIHRPLLLAARLGLGLALALGGATGCKKSGDAVEAVQGKKPPIVKAKKPGADAKGKAGDAVAKADGDANSGRTPQAAAAPAAPTPTVAPAPVPAIAPAVVAAPAPAPAPVVPVPVGRGKAADVVAKADKAEPAKADAAKPEPAKAEPPKPVRPEPPVKAEEPPLPPGAVAVHATATEPPLDVNGYIIAADLPKVLGSKQKFHRTELVGINPTPAYNAMFYATDKPDLFGVSVQVWHDPNLAESRTRFNTMKNSYSNVSPTNKITDMGFRSFYGSVVTLVFVDPRRPLLAAVSCSTKVCTGDQMIELARRVAERLH